MFTRRFDEAEALKTTEAGAGEEKVVRVSGTSKTSAVAGAIAGIIRERRVTTVQAIGAIAVNQAVKAMILARSYLSEDGIDIWFSAEFADVDIDGNIRTAMRFMVIVKQAEG